MKGGPAAALLARLIGALLSEELLNAEPTGEAGEGRTQQLRIDLGKASYLFQASRIAFGSYLVDPETVRRLSRGVLGDHESEPAQDPGMPRKPAGRSARCGLQYPDSWPSSVPSRPCPSRPWSITSSARPCRNGSDR